jgi:GTPase SAR1 family protein
MKLTVAYGLPASGKTTLLRSLCGTYYDFDKPNTRHRIKEFLMSLSDDKDYIVDFLLRKPNDFIIFFFNEYPNSTLVIYKFNISRDVCLERDYNRQRIRQCTKLINSMRLENIDKTNKNLKIYEVT